MTLRSMVPTLVLLLIVVLSPSSPAGGSTAQGSSQEVTLEKATNGVDADIGPGVSVEAGQAVTWTWTVTASGSTTLYDIVVSDTGPVQPNCDINGDGRPDGTNIHPGPLAPGQSIVCVASGGADLDPAAGTYAATGRVRASDFAASVSLEDSDPSHHTPTPPFTPTPGVGVQALVNGQIAEEHAAPLVAEGSAVTWTYVVTNTGNVPLVDIEVGDRTGLPIDCGNGASAVAGPLQPEASVTCTATSTAANQTAGRQSTIAAVVAAAVHPRTNSPLGRFEASDAAAYIPVKVAGTLAFTGPGDPVLPVGLILIGAGAGLSAMARQRTLPGPYERRRGLRSEL